MYMFLLAFGIIGASAVFGGIVAATAPGHGLLGNCWKTETRDDPRHVKAADVKLAAGASPAELPASEVDGKTSTAELHEMDEQTGGKLAAGELNGNRDVNGYGSGELAVADIGEEETEEKSEKTEEKPQPLGRFGLPQF